MAGIASVADPGDELNFIDEVIVWEFALWVILDWLNVARLGVEVT